MTRVCVRRPLRYPGKQKKGGEGEGREPTPNTGSRIARPVGFLISVVYVELQFTISGVVHLFAALSAVSPPR